MSDLELKRFAGGDASEEAFEKAVPALAQLVRGYLAWFGAESEQLEDLAQEAIVRVYINRGRRRGTGVASLKSWLRTLCRNLVVDCGRGNRAVPLSVVGDRPAPDPRGTELAESLGLCIERLREPDRTVLRLRYEEAWSTSGIAELFGWKTRNCELILARARAALSQCLRFRGHADTKE